MAMVAEVIVEMVEATVTTTASVEAIVEMVEATGTTASMVAMVEVAPAVQTRQQEPSCHRLARSFTKLCTNNNDITQFRPSGRSSEAVSCPMAFRRLAESVAWAILEAQVDHRSLEN